MFTRQFFDHLSRAERIALGTDPASRTVRAAVMNYRCELDDYNQALARWKRLRRDRELSRRAIGRTGSRWQSKP